MAPSNERHRRDWPALDYPAWQDTCSALHLWTQIVGKYRLAHTPWVNHSWHVTLYVTPRGLTTGPVPEAGGQIAIDFDFCRHRLLVRGEKNAKAKFDLGPMSVAEFFRRTREAIAEAGGSPEFHGVPNELPEPVPFAEDHRERPYDAEAVERFHGALLAIEPVFQKFRTGFLGKVSPVHLFWGALDLAVTRFSGRRAPLHPGGIPYLPDPITREAYSHEVSSAGFWPGGGGIDEACFYAYAYPEPGGFRDASVEPEAAYYHGELGEFLLPYEAVRTADDPESTLLAFLQSTYRAAADLADWDREALEGPLGEAGRPRPMEDGE